MDSWEKLDETTLPDKEEFYSNLNLENISDEGHFHAQKVWEGFEIKSQGEYYDLICLKWYIITCRYVSKCHDIYGLDPVYFVSAPGLAWKACLKKTGVKLELLTNYDVILMTEEGIRGDICQTTHRYAKANNKYMKNYDKNIHHMSSYIEYLEANSLYVWVMSL